MQLIDERNGTDKVLKLLQTIMMNRFSEQQKTALDAYARNQKLLVDDPLALVEWIAHDQDCKKHIAPNIPGHKWKDVKNHAHELQGARNKWAHHNPLDHGDAWRTADTAGRLLKTLDLPAEQMENLRREFPSPDSRNRIAIIACGKTKKNYAAPARELYTGPIYLAAREAAENDGLPYFILSSEWGLRDPATMTEPYEKAVENMTDQERQEWENLLERHIKEKLTVIGIRHVIFLAGGKYRKPLEEILDRHGITHETHRKWRDICDNVFRRNND